MIQPVTSFSASTSSTTTTPTLSALSCTIKCVVISPPSYPRTATEENCHKICCASSSKRMTSAAALVTSSRNSDSASCELRSLTAPISKRNACKLSLDRCSERNGWLIPTDRQRQIQTCSAPS